jgi:hypothetical protein
MRLVPRSPDTSLILLTTGNSVEKIIEHTSKIENASLQQTRRRTRE